MNLNQLDSVLTWDLPITFSGQTFATRPLTLADLAFIARLSAKVDQPQMADVAARLFVPADGLDAWLATFRPEHLVATIEAALQYMRDTLAKNSQAITSKVKEAMAANSLPPAGSSMAQ